MPLWPKQWLGVRSRNYLGRWKKWGERLQSISEILSRHLKFGLPHFFCSWSMNILFIVSCIPPFFFFCKVYSFASIYLQCTYYIMILNNFWQLTGEGLFKRGIYRSFKGPSECILWPILDFNLLSVVGFSN